ncbi:hypothetical protein Kpol_2000p111 [Vanderwaltozyma polyspora DSM 70294]|uniref:Uncharacterized protein n=1 Tax=Vanderwaltozyma polyspora (strain ATCC 22028 / DSM 70294 / BCRC 21397 / CBS 2163 / NBRC 10782 / NRRL Y-8283 / UCD 57-17) TaxID=436907 RepID=A7TFB8_VANPO|nr:uncharacterized protein Kpol_2000p111 [Vanderwaltozyma polyspora DSM 70294]EDO19143.1 hypothetical protein Kpol_2000p111 [Vanderwaltozyma polyspora DSM 70294]
MLPILVCWFAGLLVCWFAGLLVCWFAFNASHIPTICKIFYAIITDEEKYRGYLNLIIRLSCYDWNKPSKKLPSTISYLKFRYILDSLKCWTAYATLFRSVQLNNISSTLGLFISSNDSEQSKAYRSIKYFYKRLLKSITKVPRHSFIPLGDNKYSLNGKQFQKEYLVDLYSDAKKLFDSKLEDLGLYYKDLIDVSVVAEMTIKSPKCVPFESRDQPMISITDLFTIDTQRSVIPTIGFYNEDDHNRIINLVVDCLTFLILMIYISSGSPYRFPEMRVLKFAGNARNLFINPIDKTVELITTF